MAKIKTTIEDRIKVDIDLLANKSYLVGIDEVGWGCIAGDLYLGAVLIDKDLLEQWINFSQEDKEMAAIRDSKKLSEKQRQEIKQKIEQLNLKGLKIIFGIGSIEDINSKGLAPAFDLALESIFSQIKAQGIDLSQVNFAMDGKRVPTPLTRYETKLLIKGDDNSLVIGLASIMAKEARDEYIKQMDEKFPGYNFTDHKGYGTKAHVEALKTQGLSPIHRLKSTKTILS